MDNLLQNSSYSIEEKPSTLKQLLDLPKKGIITFLMILAITFSATTIFTYVHYTGSLVSKEFLINKNDSGLILLDDQGKPFFRFYQAKNNTYTPLSEIPGVVQYAIISVEDKDFYYHPGFSPKAIIRSLVNNVRAGSLDYGGSTITQQLVKNSLLTPEKDFLRKYQEIILANEIEKRFSKQEILEMYLNSVYFGEGVFGIEDAAHKYFSKSAKNLTLGESAILIGLLPAPTYLSPLSGNMEKSVLRQKYVLQKMYEQGYITNAEKETGEKEELTFEDDTKDLNTVAPHFALMVRDELNRKFGEERVERSGFKVKTTINLAWQKYAENVVNTQVERLKKNNVTNAAVVVIDPKTGEVKALVGSRNWYDDSFGKINMATSPRSPGSSFKPIVYLAGFEKGVINPSTILNDKLTLFKLDNYDVEGYSPKNYDGRFRGQVTVRRALANSLNVPSVEVMSKVRVSDALEMAGRLGVDSLKEPANYGLSLVLGTGEVPLTELTNAYATLANSGQKNDLILILEIEDKFGNKIYSYHPNPKQVVDPKYTFLITSILSDKGARREIFGHVLDTSKLAAVKTGTAEGYRDSLTLGYTNNLAVGVWVGNSDGEPMDQVAGSLGAAPIWKALIEKFSQGTKQEKVIPPPGVVAKYTCPGSGLILKDSSSSGVLEYFVEGNEPKGYCIIQRPDDLDDKDNNEGQD